ncbi:MAG: hypothetical protein J0L77_09420 [Alphaproteobacteria bacterium]|nr:hypothetical protein [Alphaproteobacteria bacterium]
MIDEDNLPHRQSLKEQRREASAPHDYKLLLSKHDGYLSQWWNTPKEKADLKNPEYPAIYLITERYFKDLTSVGQGWEYEIEELLSAVRLRMVKSSKLPLDAIMIMAALENGCSVHDFNRVPLKGYIRFPKVVISHA